MRSCCCSLPFYNSHACDLCANNQIIDKPPVTQENHLKTFRDIDKLLTWDKPKRKK
jgi:hypothetical protein